VTAVISFSRELGSWIVDGLHAKWPPATLILMLIEERLDARIARALVESFASAQASGQPFPLGMLVVEEVTLGMNREAWHGSDAHAAWSVAVDIVPAGDTQGEG
jgi:hypothetical protein